MAKRRSKSNTYGSSEDDFSTISSHKLLETFTKLQTPSPKLHLTPPTFNLKTFEDRRTWHPDKPKQPVQATQRAHRALVVADPPPGARKNKLPSRLSFAAPSHVLLCVRRKQRKQVLFAKRLTGAGARSRRRRNQWSSIKC